MGHHRFLPKDHVWRNQMSQFNGKNETRDAPKKGRGKGKGGPNNHNLKVVREISILFSQNIIGAWIRYIEYPEDERETLFARFKEIKFAYTCTEEELKATINSIFKKYPTKEARKAHPPDNVPVKVWEQMVDKWMDEDCQRNKSNRECLKMHHTAGSVPNTKYKYEQVKTIGIEPSPIEYFKIFHMSKTKDGEKEWASEYAEALHVCAKLEAKKESAQDQGFKIDELNIYHEVVGKASHGRVLGIGLGIKANDVYGCCKGSCKRARVDKNEELELKIKNMEEELQQYKVMKDDDRNNWIKLYIRFDVQDPPPETSTKRSVSNRDAEHNEQVPNLNVQEE
ncbi:hypothetical protein ACOSP7_020872 [Xanthoceras sorbifolium]